MSATYHQVFIQIVFAVKYRQAILDKKWRSEIFGIMGNLINESGCKAIIVNGVEDHVHCFLALNPAVLISEVVKRIKAKSSKYINDHNLTSIKFQWQRGYAVFSYSKSHTNNVFKYIENQEKHHQKKTFKAEYKGILEKFEIPHDEQAFFEDLK